MIRTRNKTRKYYPTPMKLPILTFISLLLLITGCKNPERLQRYAGVESYPEDSLLQGMNRKKAMVITAHDDDICAMSGTLSKLNAAGWEVAHMVFPNESSLRNNTHRRAASYILDTVIWIDMEGKQVRYNLNENLKAHLAIAKDQFPTHFNIPDIRQKCKELINAFSPSVILTLDNEIGGYGHPGHVFISQLVLDLAKENEISPRYIYQNVYPDSMENAIIGERLRRKLVKNETEEFGWDRAKRIYKVTGMPEPSVQVTISAEAHSKMNYLRTYGKRERKNIDYYLPEYEAYDAEVYFAIFDREFFRVIALNDPER